MSLTFVPAVRPPRHFPPMEAQPPRKPTALGLGVGHGVRRLAYLPKGAPSTLGEMMYVSEYFG